jgi:hypothetical protein
MHRRLPLSLFCALNVGTVLFMNQPAPVEERGTQALGSMLSAQNASRAHAASWLVRYYAHLAGLDNRWTMFSYLHRLDWWYVIKAAYPDGLEEPLPLPLQSPRSFLQRTFFDYKEAKFHLNIYSQPEWRKAYGRYLCRQIAERGPPTASAIVYELHYQMFLDRAAAAAMGTHLEPSSHAQIVQVVQCPA